VSSSCCASFFWILLYYLLSCRHCVGRVSFAFIRTSCLFFAHFISFSSLYTCAFYFLASSSTSFPSLCVGFDVSYSDFLHLPHHILFDQKCYAHHNDFEFNQKSYVPAFPTSSASSFFFFSASLLQHFRNQIQQVRTFLILFFGFVALSSSALSDLYDFMFIPANNHA
jgi:hypothetical protein